MQTLVIGAGTAGLAAARDLKDAGYEVSADAPRGAGHVLIPILSPAGDSSAGVQENIIQALDDGQHIIPVLAKRVQPLGVEPLRLAITGIDTDRFTFATCARYRFRVSTVFASFFR